MICDPWLGMSFDLSEQGINAFGNELQKFGINLEGEGWIALKKCLEGKAQPFIPWFTVNSPVISANSIEENKKTEVEGFLELYNEQYVTYFKNDVVEDAHLGNLPKDRNTDRINKIIQNNTGTLTHRYNTLRHVPKQTEANPIISKPDVVGSTPSHI